MKVKTDCIHFNMDRPCVFHKEKGVKCTGCSKYSPFSSKANKEKKIAVKILIIKLDAMGDVLRTTFILPGLKHKYPKSHITWAVSPESYDIINGNPFIDRIWKYDEHICTPLLKEKFDIAINLDLSPKSLSLATLAYADKKVGFSLDKKRKIVCSNSHAGHWLEMSAFDDAKKKNLRTYQYHMAKILGLARPDYEIYVPLRKESLAKADAFHRKNSLKDHVVVGINPGAGSRWKHKRWTTDGYKRLIKEIAATGGKVVLFGGPQEKELIDELQASQNGNVVSAGTDNPLPDFFALINLCEIFITGDTLALHAALGLQKKVIALFGPTSAAEIEMYKRGIKIVSPADCVCCYIPDCAKKPTCMDMINPGTVWSAFLRSFGSGIMVI